MTICVFQVENGTRTTNWIASDKCFNKINERKNVSCVRIDLNTFTQRIFLKSTSSFFLFILYFACRLKNEIICCLIEIQENYIVFSSTNILNNIFLVSVRILKGHDDAQTHDLANIEILHVHILCIIWKDGLTVFKSKYIKLKREK